VRQNPTNGTYASIVISTAFLSEKQLVDMTTGVGHTDMEGSTVNMTLGSNAHCPETDICMDDTTGPSTTELGIPQTPAEGLGSVVNETLQHDCIVERMDMIGEDTKRNKPSTKRKGDLLVEF
jgi:hypothetical protein